MRDHLLGLMREVRLGVMVGISVRGGHVFHFDRQLVLTGGVGHLIEARGLDFVAGGVGVHECAETRE